MSNLWTGSVDSHAHAFGENDGEFFEAYRQKQGFSHVNLVSVACARPGDPFQNALALNIKHRNCNVYAHASLVYDAFPVEGDNLRLPSFARQAQMYREAGFDGIKLLENKPTLFQKTRMMLSAPAYDAFFADLEAHGTHIVWHACDPAPFWDEALAPAFARESGWLYTDGTFETKEKLTQDVIRVLRAHPKLNATMAHFFFLSDDFARAAALLEEFPNFSLDITPGREMYDNFTRNYEEARAFFHKYAHRLHFGTDMTADEFQGGQTELVETMRRFLSTEDAFSYWDFDIRGVGLSPEKVRLIAGDNFRRAVSETPREIDPRALKDLLLSALDAGEEHRAYLQSAIKAL